MRPKRRSRLIAVSPACANKILRDGHVLRKGAVMEREGEGGRQRGFFVAFGDTKDAEDECRAFFMRTGRIIKLLTVQKILDEEHVQKM